MTQNLIAFFLTGLIITILIPWACLETASFLSDVKSTYSRRSHWLLAVAFAASLTLAGCAGGSKDDGAIVSPKEGGAGAGVTHTESGESLSPTAGGSVGGGTTSGGTESAGTATAGEGAGTGGGGSGGAVLGEPPLEEGPSPALIMHVINTILN